MSLLLRPVLQGDTRTDKKQIHELRFKYFLNLRAYLST